jgi:hypothetical protein
MIIWQLDLQLSVQSEPITTKRCGLTPLQQYFSYIMAVTFIGGGKRSTLFKLLTHRKSLTNFIT